MKNLKIYCVAAICLAISQTQYLSATPIDTIRCMLDIDKSAQTINAELTFQASEDSLTVSFPAWSPGYYQIMNYGEWVTDISCSVKNKSVGVKQNDVNTWLLTGCRGLIKLRYKVKASRNFVASSYVGTTYTYLTTGSVFPMINNNTKTPFVIQFVMDEFETLATALSFANKNTVVANDIDELYDSPMLVGKLTELAPFYVRGKKHRFVSVTKGDFDTTQFRNNLQNVVSAAANVVDDIPYDEYIFLAIGPGNGGIEHLRSTAFAFDEASLKTRDGRLSMLSFLGHEYFHHYNVKRIRPISLGPFDYSKENTTTELWISEGLTVYYDHMLLFRAGLNTKEELLASFSEVINSYESDDGKTFQTLEDASYKTWSDGPFGQSGENDKTISIYQKGAIIGLLLDFEIIHSTKGKKNLDDLMRYLYNTYYLEKKRGFTKDEFRKACERVAGKRLNELFKFVETTETITYEKFLTAAGLSLKSTTDGKHTLLELTKKSKEQSKLFMKWIEK